MVDPQTGCVLTFNGEIYNYLDLREELQEKGHLFLGSSDTEVILVAYRQWGVDLRNISWACLPSPSGIHENKCFLRSETGREKSHCFTNIHPGVFASPLS